MEANFKARFLLDSESLTIKLPELKKYGSVSTGNVSGLTLLFSDFTAGTQEWLVPTGGSQGTLPTELPTDTADSQSLLLFFSPSER